MLISLKSLIACCESNGYSSLILDIQSSMVASFSMLAFHWVVPCRAVEIQKLLTGPVVLVTIS